jgi:hypothetical protein
VGIGKEGMHTIKTGKFIVVVMKIDLQKAYDKVNSMYLRSLLMSIGMCQNKFVNWIIGFLSLVSFVFITHGSSSKIFQASKGLRQGCILSPIVSLFFLVSKGSGRLILEEKRGAH